MQHWRACRLREEVDEGCHSRRTYKQVRKVHYHEQKISISPHTAKVLAHRQVLLQNLLHRTLAPVVLASHRVWVGSTKRGKKIAIEFVRVEKCKGTGAVASIDVFEAEALGLYL